MEAGESACDPWSRYIENKALTLTVNTEESAKAGVFALLPVLSVFHIGILFPIAGLTEILEFP
jgi:hypothetical protein